MKEDEAIQVLIKHTAKEKELPGIKELAEKGDVAAMRTLREVHGYETIKVNGKLVSLREI